MEFLKSLAEYFEATNMPPPKHPHFYVGKHEHNIRRVKKVLAPVKHELYSISLIIQGSHIIKIGNAASKKVSIRSPFKSVGWDIRNETNIQGIIIIFSNEFVKENVLWSNLLIDFPFFRHSSFFNEDLDQQVVDELYGYFNKVYEYFHSDLADKFEFIKAWLQIALLQMRQEYNKRIDVTSSSVNAPANKLLSDFEVLLIHTLENPDADTEFRQPSFYASKLHVHVNHLNAVVKQATGKTTSEIIQEHIIRKASAQLKQTNMPIKTIAQYFNFSATTHFVAFFKKHTGLTPKEYRKSS